MARLMAPLVVRGLASLAILLAVTLPTELAAASKSTPTKKPIRNPKFDPVAEKVDLFEAVDAGQVTVKLIPQNAMGGNVLIENKTDKTLTVKIPEAVVGISIHAQLGNIGLGNNPFGNGNNGPGGLGAGQGQQMQGGGVGMNQNGQNNGAFPIGQPNNGFQPQVNQPGIGFFSVPAEKVISLTFNSVCLEHGKPEPSPNNKYTLIPVSKVTTDPVLYQLLASVGTGKVDAQAAQAAAWHLTDKMSFEDLANKVNQPLPGLPGAPYFSKEQLSTAKDLLKQATERAAEKSPKEESADTTPKTAQRTASK